MGIFDRKPLKDLDQKPKPKKNPSIDEAYSISPLFVEAEIEVNKKNYSKALSLYHKLLSEFQQRILYFSGNGYEEVEFDAYVSKNISNVLRLKREHVDALVEMTYFISVYRRSSWFELTNKQEKEFEACFKRAKLSNIDMSELNEFLGSFVDNAPSNGKEGLECYRKIQSQIHIWNGNKLKCNTKFYVGPHMLLGK